MGSLAASCGICPRALRSSRRDGERKEGERGSDAEGAVIGLSRDRSLIGNFALPLDLYDLTSIVRGMGDLCHLVACLHNLG